MKELETAKQLLASLANEVESIKISLKEFIRDRTIVRDHGIESVERAILLGARAERMREQIDEALGAVCQAEVMADADEVLASMDKSPIPLDREPLDRGF